MCGIAGVAVSGGRPAPDPGVLLSMISQLRHRGPDGIRIYRDRQAGLACARLSIVDPLNGHQPVPNEDETVWAVSNCEIFNAEHLRERLIARGHTFRTRCDSEVIVHLYEAYGTEMFQHLNGDFAVAVWDQRRRRLLLGRDRFGVRPLFYAATDGAFLFGSEIKGLLAYPALHGSLDLQGLRHFFTFSSLIGRQTLFSGISQLEAGHYATVEAGGPPALTRYWRVPAPGQTDGGADPAELGHRLRESVRLRLSRELPNSVYLSGGLDSAALAYLAQDNSRERIKTFSVAFDHRDLDESPFQRSIARSLGTDHHELRCTPAAIGGAFPEVVRHAEAPFTRLAPVPMYLLARAVSDSGVRIALSGEGADEFLLGYDWYRAAILSEFVAGRKRLPGRSTMLSLARPGAASAVTGVEAADLAELWPTVTAHHRRPDPLFGVHRVRWARMTRLQQYLSPDVRSAISRADPVADLAASLPDGFGTLDALGRAQCLDVHTLLAGYLLSTQGDRMGMAHAVESRVPFLDHTLVAFLSLVPATGKIVGFREKWPLRQAFADVLPASIVTRRKYAYTAPALSAFLGPARGDYVRDLMNEKHIAAAGIFDPAKVTALWQRCVAGAFQDDHYVSAFVSILSTQMLSHLFFELPYRAAADVRNFRLDDRLGQR
jgi:asparagine synthase (glutamine-hydrolysing)